MISGLFEVNVYHLHPSLLSVLHSLPPKGNTEKRKVNIQCKKDQLFTVREHRWTIVSGVKLLHVSINSFRRFELIRDVIFTERNQQQFTPLGYPHLQLLYTTKNSFF